MTELHKRLKFQKAILLDGGLATELERLGCKLDDPLWSARILINDPGLIYQVHMNYLTSGADIITTASYQASIRGLLNDGIDFAGAASLLRSSVEIACRARNDFWGHEQNRRYNLRPLVAASIGPYGAFLADGSEYRGHYELSIPELMDFHKSRIEILAGTGADLLAFETLPSYKETRAILNILNELQDLPPAWLSFTCRDSKSISDGHLWEEVVKLADTCEAIVAVGVNCTHPKFVAPLVSQAASLTDKLIIAYPNSGESWDADHHSWLPNEAEMNFCRLAGEWISAGAKIIGGCCRTGPADILCLTKYK